MSFYTVLKEQNKELETITNTLEYQSDLALVVFEEFKNVYIPMLIGSAIEKNTNEVNIMIGTDFDASKNGGNMQILTVAFGEDSEIQHNLDIYSYLLIGHFISNIPGIAMLDFTMNYMDFKIDLQKLIDYYYEELQSEEYLTKSR